MTTPIEITDVRLRIPDRSDGVLAYCSITLAGEFVVKSIRLVEGKAGPFVAMPQRELVRPCPGCRGRNAVRARYCNRCGVGLEPAPATADESPRYMADEAHPLTPRMRAAILDAVLVAYRAEGGAA